MLSAMNLNMHLTDRGIGSSHHPAGHNARSPIELQTAQQPWSLISLACWEQTICSCKTEFPPSSLFAKVIPWLGLTRLDSIRSRGTSVRRSSICNKPNLKDLIPARLENATITTMCHPEEGTIHKTMIPNVESNGYDYLNVVSNREYSTVTKEPPMEKCDSIPHGNAYTWSTCHRACRLYVCQ